MALTNYRDISTSMSDVSAGFQFEFACQKCGETTRSAFKPYRKGQITGWLSRFAFLVSDFSKAGRAANAFADAGGSSAKSEALAEAMATAAPKYKRCDDCRAWACQDCWNTSHGSCNDCAGKAIGAARTGGSSTGSASARAALCPNCQTPGEGGRFCHECGFDMASTHKSCPACGTTLTRQARFCTDCGHGF